MHYSSLYKMQGFIEAYLKDFFCMRLSILDIGSMAVDGKQTYQPLFLNSNWSYTGMDVKAGPNVNLVVSDPYSWVEIASESIDVVISGQVFEHIEFPWITIKEISRILKPRGLACLIVPSTGPEHRYPVDCWRIYPDGIRALAKYAGLNVVEIFTDWGLGEWQDTFAVLQKPRQETNSIDSPFPDFEDLFVARTAYIKSLQLRPKSPSYYLNLSSILLKDNNIGAAVLAVRIGLDINPYSEELRQRLIGILLHMGSVGAAVEQTIVLLRSRPVSMITINTLVYVIERVRGIELDLLYKAFPQDRSTLQQIANIAESCGHIPLAATCWEMIIETGQADHIAYASWGITLRAMGFYKEAEEKLNIAIKMQIEEGIVNRTTVLQQLINALHAETYLEIGVERGINFFQISAPTKIAVDPFFKIPGGVTDSREKKFFQMTSDHFFEKPLDLLFKNGIDVAFIDGMHTYEQSLRDVTNCLRFLNPEGVIVLHDCLPVSEAESCPDQETAKTMHGFNGFWTGDVWRTILHLRSAFSDLEVFVLDTDHGVGIVRRGSLHPTIDLPIEIIKTMSFKDFYKSRWHLLNLQSSDYFSKWLCAYYPSSFRKY